MKEIRTANQVTVTLNEALLQTITAQNKKFNKLFQMVVAQATDKPPTNNQMVVTPPARQ